MRKIPTLFVRDDSGDITREVTPGCEWVFEGLGRPTRKYDGTACMFDLYGWWSRRMVREGSTPPPDFMAVYVTKTEPFKTFGWIPMESSPIRKFHLEALESVVSWKWEYGTYELIGPKINGNPEGLSEHRLQRHAAAETMWLPAKIDFDFLEEYFLIDLAPKNIEGIVWHGPAGNMAKLKVSDFAKKE